MMNWDTLAVPPDSERGTIDKSTKDILMIIVSFNGRAVWIS